MGVEKLTHDDQNGVTEEFMYDETDNTVGVRHTQDVAPILKQVADIRLSGGGKVDGLGHLIGEIPMTVAMEYARLRGIPWEKLVYSPDYADEMLKLCMMNPALNPTGAAV